MRTVTRIGLGMFVAGAAIAQRADSGAGGAIGIGGAAIETGAAPDAGSVVLEEEADLGPLPPLRDFEQLSTDLDAWTPNSRFDFDGLGGQDFHATTDVELPDDLYDFRSFTVDRGVSVTFTSPAAMVRVVRDVVIDGRIGGERGLISMIVGGSLTMLGHDDPVKTGIFDADGGADQPVFQVYVRGPVDVSADQGAKVHFATDRTDFMSFSRAAVEFTDAVGGVGLSSGGDIHVTRCDGDGRRMGFASDFGGITVEGGSYFSLGAYALGGDVNVSDVTCTGGDAGGSGFVAARGSLRIERTSIEGGIHQIQALDDVTVAGCDFTMPQDAWNLQLTSARGSVRIDADSKIDYRGTQEFWILAGDGIRIEGELLSNSRQMEIVSRGGDLVFADGSAVSCTMPMKLGAQGAVVAEGGTATLSASALDVSCVTGDLDLDVGSMTATNGRFLALANGVVRLRGEYSATRDIQLLSRKDAIDAVGATLATADAGAALSGFVRLATFSSNATIDATDAAIRTGASDAQSGDVLLQIARSGGESSTAQIEVVTVGARRMPDGAIVTRIRGTMRGRAIRAASSSGSGRVAFGRTAHRLMLRGHGGHVSGVAGGAKMSIRGGSSRATFTVELREASAEAGELTELEIDRAGFHAKGKFRRPRAD